MVRTRREPAGAVDPAELLVELPERLERVGALEAGVVRDLVVAREGRVHRGAAAHHVGEDAVDDQVAHDDAERGPHQRVDAAAVAAWSHVAPRRPERRRPFEQDLPREEDESPGDVEAVREERAIAGVRPLLGAHPAHGQDHLVRLAGEQVAAARAPVASRPIPVERSRSISSQSPGPEQAMTRPVSLSTQRKAGMSSFDPSRMPAWLAPVCDERSGSHSTRRYVPD